MPHASEGESGGALIVIVISSHADGLTDYLHTTAATAPHLVGSLCLTLPYKNQHCSLS